MKKFILLAVIALTAFVTGVQAQNSTKYEPYIGGGVSISRGNFSQGGEIGIYNNRTWFAATYARAEGEDYAGVKAYYKLNNPNRPNFIDTYASLGTSFHLAQDKALTIEPGAAVVFNTFSRVAPQLSLSFPLNDQLKGGTAVFGAGINIWLY